MDGSAFGGKHFDSMFRWLFGFAAFGALSAALLLLSVIGFGCWWLIKHVVFI